MRAKFILTILGLWTLLVACSRAGDLVETAGSREVEEQPAETPAAHVSELSPIPCSGVLTSPNQEGPFYRPGSPERSSLIDEEMPGVPILMVCHVFDQECNPVPCAKLDFWLADVNGEYDNSGYHLRGHMIADLEGNYSLESIEPTAYTGRPPHIRVKVSSPNGEELLTTQMYFAGSEGSGDVSTAPDLLATYLESDETERQQAIFNFVVQN